MTPSPVIAAVGLGGNQGDVASTLGQAMRALGELPSTRLLARSRAYRSPAWGLTDQPDFINAAVLLETGLDAPALLDALLRIERAHGRDRDTAGALRWGPRPLDLDLLVHGDAVIDAPGLVVPHPHLHERAFVLVPLAEIAPDLHVPGRGRVADLLPGVDAGGIEALP